MPRKGPISKRKLLPDPKFHDKLVTQFINNLMRRGKKSVAEQIFYDSLNTIEQKLKEDPLQVFRKAVDNIKPVVEVKSRRVGGATYQVPVEVPTERKLALAIRWLIGYAKSRTENKMEERLAAELIDAYNRRGNAYKKREDVHKMAEANKAFAHYRW
ncbi:MAG: 30S ribosomal protein S7 [Myxococcales bacterium]|nr:MAG: 30S ribosomal protein S7 [Myxococcales bacterium]